MADLFQLLSAAGDTGTALIAYVLWRHEARIGNLERKG